MTTESVSYYLNENPQYYKDKHIIITGATGTNVNDVAIALIDI
jgi:glycerate-2-kinase